MALRRNGLIQGEAIGVSSLDHACAGAELLAETRSGRLEGGRSYKKEGDGGW